MGCCYSRPERSFVSVEMRRRRSWRVRSRLRSRRSRSRAPTEVSAILVPNKIVATLRSSPRFFRRRRHKSSTNPPMRRLPIFRVRTSTPLPRKHATQGLLCFEKICGGMERGYGLFEHHLEYVPMPDTKIFPGFQSWSEIIAMAQMREDDFSDDSTRLEPIQVVYGTLQGWKFRTDWKIPFEPRVKLVKTTVSESYECFEDVENFPDYVTEIRLPLKNI
ncbi:hypothetical protein DMENIID0001_083720 [Sergentomyia squamirostris]